MNIEFLSNLVITKVYSATTMYTSKNTRMKDTCRTNWAIGIKYEGETVYTSNGKQILSNLNHVVIMPKGSSYEWTCTKSGHFSIIEFESKETYREPLCFSVKNGEKIAEMFKSLETKRNLKMPLMEIRSIRDTYSILFEIIESTLEQYSPTETQQKIAPAIEYISQNYNKNIRNDLLAEITGFSTVYFRKLFTRIMGVSPMTYAHQVRIEKAKEMLKSDYGTLSDVALSLGYSNSFNFSRDFKNRTGISPSKYKRR